MLVDQCIGNSLSLFFYSSPLIESSSSLLDNLSILESLGFLQSSQYPVTKYEIGEEVGRGHFGYTCSAIVKKGELKGQKVVRKVIPKAKKELNTLGLLEWNKSRVTAEIPKYGKKVPKNMISAVAGFTAVYWLYNCSDMFKITSFKDTSGVLITY
ncbi:hypothetical protein KY289_030393 [Solanum tuberosum]|nr:hypothetical protein KY289_030393 [Solanum tuberosum]